jgi:hypothetical protein
MSNTAITTEIPATATPKGKAPKPAAKTEPSEVAPTSPTTETYDGLQELYDHFNRELFAGKLPACLVTLRARGKTRGYYSAKRFTNHAGDSFTDELALNATDFHQFSVADNASTVAHEMVHHWQARFGAVKSRGGYHNKEWAAKMREIGLRPTDDGTPDGKQTGFKMTHVVVGGGPFEVSFNRFLLSGRTVKWGDIAVATKPKGKPNRIKYECEGCGAAVWGKAGLAIACIDCGNRPMDMEIAP